jgi:hypothetical protein
MNGGCSTPSIASNVSELIPNFYAFTAPNVVTS